MSDKVRLKAFVARPAEEGIFPVVVMPSSWALDYREYTLQARKLAKHGYIAVSFTSRGFWDAGGDIGIADQRTLKDVSEVIDWAIATQDADAQRVAVGGVSYGAGIALLAASRDDRIRAVFCLSGWTDLATSVYYNDTVSSRAVKYLGHVARITGRMGNDLINLLNEAASNSISSESLNGAVSSRSAVSVMPALNVKKPAILQVNSWNDSLFPPTQFYDFYQHYEGPYRLILTTGDHGTHELGGLAGLPNESWDETIDWLNQHLGLSAILKPRTSIKVYTNNSKKVLTFTDVNTVPVDEKHYQLTEPVQGRNGTYVGGMTGEPEKPVSGTAVKVSAKTAESTSWQFGIKGGLKTGATSGVMLITGLSQDWFSMSKTVKPKTLARKGAAVWRGPQMAQSSIIFGSPRLQLPITSTKADCTIMVYLYDEDINGSARLITHAPHSVRGCRIGYPTLLAVRLHTMCYELNAGHRLTLAIDTQDRRYDSLTDFGDTIEISVTPDEKSMLTVPFLAGES